MSDDETRRIGIITYHNGSNYGAALQAFALQEYLGTIYNDVKIINYDNYFISKGLRRIRWGRKPFDLYCTFIDVFSYEQNKKKVENFQKFFQNKYRLTQVFTREELKTSGAGVDICVSGSDQIWNPNLRGFLDDIYLGCIEGVMNRLSYASSFGNYRFENEQANGVLMRELRNFDGVTVRENANALFEKIGINARNVIDPTLLLDKKEWGKRLGIRDCIIGQAYLLIYPMTESDSIIKYGKEVAALRGLRPVVIGNYLKQLKGVTYIRDAGPLEFVNLFFFAEYVVTNSFHGTAFSINFEKNFISVLNKKSPERAVQLLNATGLSTRLVNGYQSYNLSDLIDDDFSRAREYLSKERKWARKYLSMYVGTKNNDIYNTRNNSWCQTF